MKILVSWLRDFVDVPVPIKDLAWDLNLCGFEVASVEPCPPLQGEPEDAVIDFEITANRPDCLSVDRHGTRGRHPLRRAADDCRRLGPWPAREGATRRPSGDDRGPGALPAVHGDARRRSRIGPSPAWMVRRLEAAGVRRINNVVDVTNYVLLETGHPLHAFDLERLGGGELRIRCAAPGERMTTLDEQSRALDPEMLVIADATRPQAVAGVMGGGNSEVHAGTRTIAIESAYFQPASVRRTSKRLGLSTEASYRFERGADVEAPLRALARTCELLEQIWRGHAAARVDRRVSGPPRRCRRFRCPSRASAGSSVTTSAPSRPSASCAASGSGWCDRQTRGSVSVPTWRDDVSRDVDLYEEIADTTATTGCRSPSPPSCRRHRRPRAAAAHRAGRRSGSRRARGSASR